MRDFNLRSQTVRGYAVSAPAKSGVGIGVPDMHKAIQTRPASFLSSASTHIQIMVGWMGAPKGAPGSLCTGYANPVQFTTSEIGVSGGEVISLHKDAANMATTPTLLHPQFSAISAMEVRHA